MYELFPIIMLLYLFMNLYLSHVISFAYFYDLLIYSTYKSVETSLFQRLSVCLFRIVFLSFSPNLKRHPNQNDSDKYKSMLVRNEIDKMEG